MPYRTLEAAFQMQRRLGTVPLDQLSEDDSSNLEWACKPLPFEMGTRGTRSDRPAVTSKLMPKRQRSAENQIVQGHIPKKPNILRQFFRNGAKDALVYAEVNISKAE